MKKLGIMIITAAAMLLCGCAKEEAETVAVPTEIPEKKVVVTCAGDCTLGTDVNFGGDTLPVAAKRMDNDYSYFLKNVKPIFEEDDLTIVNLEGTLTERGEREDKTFAFRGKPEYVDILKEGSVEAVTLANNHSRDYGEVSFSDTKDTLENAGIEWAYKKDVSVGEYGGVKVGIIGLYDLDGSAEKTLPEAMNKVKEAGAELVIAEIHWGIEGENTPEEEQRELAKKIVDAGADLVVGHHPHVLQGVEKYKGKYIIYSLGNFCFGGNQNPRDKDTMIFRQTFTIDENGNVKTDDDYTLIPCRISSVTSANDYCPTPLTGSEAERAADKIRRFSKSFMDGELKFSVFENGELEAMSESSADEENEEKPDDEEETEPPKKKDKKEETPKSNDVVIL